MQYRNNITRRFLQKLASGSFDCTLPAIFEQSIPVWSFQPEHRSGHPEKYIFCLPRQKPGSKYPRHILFNFGNINTDEYPYAHKHLLATCCKYHMLWKEWQSTRDREVRGKKHHMWSCKQHRHPALQRVLVWLYCAKLGFKKTRSEAEYLQQVCTCKQT